MMSEAAAAPEKTPEDLRLEKVLADVIEAPFGQMKIAQAVQDVERVAAAGNADDAHERLAKLADPASGCSELVKALSSAWLARARTAVGVAARLHNQVHDTVAAATRLPGGLAGAGVAHIASGDLKLGAETGGRISQRALLLGGGAAAGTAGVRGKKKQKPRQR